MKCVLNKFSTLFLIFAIFQICNLAFASQTVLSPVFETCSTLIPRYTELIDENLASLVDIFYSSTIDLSKNNRYCVVVRLLKWYPMFHKKFHRSDNIFKIPFKFSHPCVSLISSFIRASEPRVRLNKIHLFLMWDHGSRRHFLFAWKSPVPLILLVPLPKIELQHNILFTWMVQGASFTIGLPVVFVCSEYKRLFILDRFRSDEIFFREKKNMIENSPTDFEKHKINSLLILLPLFVSVKEVISLWKNANYNWNMNKYALEPYIKYCDNLKTLQKVSPLLLLISPEKCTQRVILSNHNCTSASCYLLFNQLFSFGKFQTFEGSYELEYSTATRTVLTFGYKFRHLQYALFHISPAKQSKAMQGVLSLLQPISNLGWIMIMVTFGLVALTFKLFKIRNPIWTTLKVMLENDIEIHSFRSWKSTAAIIWIFACILLRNVYTSSLYSYITAVPLPSVPNSFKEFLAEKSFEVFDAYSSGISVVLKNDGELNESSYNMYTEIEELKVFKQCYIKDLFQFLVHLRYPGKNAYCYTDLQKLTGHHNKKLLGDMQKFGLIYKQSMTFILKAILKTESRLMFRNLQTQESMMTELLVYKSLFTTVFNQFFEKDLARLEYSGILQKIRWFYHNIDLKEKQNYIARFRSKMQNTEIDQFAKSLEQTSSVEVKYKHANEKAESTKFSDLIVVWLLLGYLLGTCVFFLFYEVIIWHHKIGNLKKLR